MDVYEAKLTSLQVWNITACYAFMVEKLLLQLYYQLFTEGEVIIGEYSPRRSRGEYSPIITKPEANNCFSIFLQVLRFSGLNSF
jgi:hypothetical protein